MTDRGYRGVYAWIIRLALAVIRLMRWKVIVHGAEHIPASGPGIVATNHVSYLDFVFSGFAARERGRLIRFVAKKEIFDARGVGWLMRQMRHIPVDRFGDPAAVMNEVELALEDGDLVGMFPEGTISPSFVPREGKNGTVRMAQRSGAPLIPAAIWGTQRIITKWRPKNFQRGVAMVIVVGEPIPLDPDDDPDVVTKQLMERIGDLLAEAQDRYPQEPAGDDDRWWLPAHRGGTAPTPEDAEVRLAEERERKRRARGA